MLPELERGTIRILNRLITNTLIQKVYLYGMDYKTHVQNDSKVKG